MTPRDVLPEGTLAGVLIEHCARGAVPDRGDPGPGPGARLTRHEAAAAAGVGRGVSAPSRGLLAPPHQVVGVRHQLSVAQINVRQRVLGTQIVIHIDINLRPGRLWRWSVSTKRSGMRKSLFVYDQVTHWVPRGGGCWVHDVHAASIEARFAALVTELS